MRIKKRHFALILVPALLLTPLQPNAKTRDDIVVPGNCTKNQHKSWPWYADSSFKVGFKWAVDQLNKTMGRSGDRSGGNWNLNLKKCTKKCTRRAGLSEFEQTIRTSPDQLRQCIQECMGLSQP